MKDIVVVSGADAKNRMDEQIKVNSVRYVASDAASQVIREGFSSADALALQPLQSDGDSTMASSPLSSFHRMGLAKHIFRCCQEEELGCVCALLFCFEGNNVPDGIDMASQLNTALNILPGTKEWPLPSSWDSIVNPRLKDTNLALYN